MANDDRAKDGDDDRDDGLEPARRDLPQPKADKPKADKDRGGEDKGGSDDDTSDDDEGDDNEKDDKPDKPPIYKRPLFWILGTIVLVLLIVGGILWWLHARRFESSDDAFVDAHVVRIAAQVSGQLVELVDADNRHVKPGQLLAVIQPDGPQSQLAEARANVAQVRAQEQQALAGVATAIAQRRQAAAQALSPQANAVRAARDYARYLELKRIDPLAPAASQIDTARAQAEDYAAQAAAARRTVAAQDANIVSAQRNVDAARAQIDAAQARVKQAGITVGYLRIVAPLAGQVVNRQVNVGTIVAPGSQLMAIVPDRIWVTANFKETQLTLMKIGQHVDIKVDAYPDVKFVGHIDSIQRGAGQAFSVLPAQNATGNYVKVVQRVPVRILFDHPDHNTPDPRAYAIGPGMSVVPTVTVR